MTVFHRPFVVMPDLKKLRDPRLLATDFNGGHTLSQKYPEFEAPSPKS